VERSVIHLSDMHAQHLLLIALVAFPVQAFCFALGRYRITRPRVLHRDSSFDGKEFEDALKKAGPVWNPSSGSSDSEDALRKIRDEQIAKSEEIYRKYPYEDTLLPLLPDCNQYYSGSFGDYFWHQNADQVLVYIPVDDSVTKKDVEAVFEAKRVRVAIKGEEVISFDCLERIIPDGSFFIFEESKGKKYLQLDLEKRFRMINWKGLFGKAVEEDVRAIDNRSKMLEKLFSANKGIAKLTGASPESVNEMMSNEDLVKMISDKVYGPQVVGLEDEEGNLVTNNNDNIIDVTGEDFEEVSLVENANNKKEEEEQE